MGMVVGRESENRASAGGLPRPVWLIVVAQLLGTSLWFSVNSAGDDLGRAWGLGPSDLGMLTNAVQLGFIAGTLIIALSGLADRYPASRIFAVSAVMGALLNAMFATHATSVLTGLPWRVGVGLCLAGVYPLGMKLVVSWVPDRAGAALAWLVGMLTLGTALPHAVRALGSLVAVLSWQSVVMVSSGLALLAAALIWQLGDGPHLQTSRSTHRLRLGQAWQSFSIPEFRASALAYFGHQWELYAFWTLVPVFLVHAGIAAPGSTAASWWAFALIGAGAIGCVVGGRVSTRTGSARVALAALLMSALCCAVFPWSLQWPLALKIILLLLWGASAVADSPHFSAMSARACPPDRVGSSLALQNSLGFAITMVSIQLGSQWVSELGANIAWLLLPGPVMGAMALRRLAWRGH